MTRILVVGYDPTFVDFSDPGMPPDLSAEKVHDGVERGMRALEVRGIEAEHCTIRPDDEAAPTVERQLRTTTYDGVVIGAGVRLFSRRLQVFEAVINVVHRHALNAAIGFNAGLDDLPEAVERMRFPEDR